MSKIAEFATQEVDNVVSECRAALEGSRKWLDKFRTDKQKDGADSEALVKAYARIDRALAALILVLAVLAGCAVDAKPGPTVKLSFEQADVPADIQAAVEQGARAWESLGVSYDDHTIGEPCALAWYDTKTFPCVLVVDIDFAASSTLGKGIAALTTNRRTTLAYELTGDELVNVAAHEIGHSLWNTSDHLPAGEIGIMSAYVSSIIEPTDDDRSFVEAHTNSWYVP
jgi:hypothetical protein